MNIVNLEEYKTGTEAKRPRIISFHSALYNLEDGTNTTTNIHVRVEDGDVVGILENVMETGGIGQMGDDEIYRFIPWPCAAVEIRDA